MRGVALLLGAVSVSGEGGRDESIARLAGAGVELSPADWEALPEAARRRLNAHAIETPADRARLEALVAWLRAEFPPGWSRSGGER